MSDEPPNLGKRRVKFYELDTGISAPYISDKKFSRKQDTPQIGSLHERLTDRLVLEHTSSNQSS